MYNDRLSSDVDNSLVDTTKLRASRASACRPCRPRPQRVNEVTGTCSSCRMTQMLPVDLRQVRSNRSKDIAEIHLQSHNTADCSNLGVGVMGAYTCGDDYEAPLIPHELESSSFDLWECTYRIGGRKLCTGYKDCDFYGACSICEMYEVKIETNDVMDQCSHCRVCNAGGVDADCTNIGYSSSICHFPELE